MRFVSLRLKDFKGFIDETLDLNRALTVLVGPNGSGKSSVLEALAVLAGDIIAKFHAPDQRVPRFLAEAIDVRNSATSGLVEATIAQGDKTHRAIVEFAVDPGTRRLREPLAPSAVDYGYASFFAKAGGMPLFFRYSPGRNVGRAWRQSKDDGSPLDPRVDDPVVASTDAFDGDLGFTPFLRWFHERENVENELKVSRKDLSFEDPQLSSVRKAVTSMLPGYGDLRIQRDPLHLVVSKNGSKLYLEQLSDGEKSVIAMVADIARRLAIAQPQLENPLDTEAVVTIDEVDLHLHPAWQRSIVGRLRETFRNCQFIATTHSPQVLSEIPTDAIIVLRDCRAEAPAAPTSGRDSNAILTEVLQVPERPQQEADALLHVSRLIDEDRLGEAQVAVDKLAKRLTESDGEIVRLRTMLHFLAQDA